MFAMLVNVVEQFQQISAPILDIRVHHALRLLRLEYGKTPHNARLCISLQRRIFLCIGANCCGQEQVIWNLSVCVSLECEHFSSFHLRIAHYYRNCIDPMEYSISICCTSRSHIFSCILLSAMTFTLFSLHWKIPDCW